MSMSPQVMALTPLVVRPYMTQIPPDSRQSKQAYRTQDKSYQEQMALLRQQWADPTAAYEEEMSARPADNQEYQQNLALVNKLSEQYGFRKTTSQDAFYGVDKKGARAIEFRDDQLFSWNKIEGSPLNIDKHIAQLREEVEALGEDAAAHQKEIDTTLQNIINNFISGGKYSDGYYTKRDAKGVEESIRALFAGEVGKYSIDDLKAMATLSYERVVPELGKSEYEIGVKLGFEIYAVEIALKSDKLSKAAKETIGEALAVMKEETIIKNDEVLEAQAKQKRNHEGYSFTPTRESEIQKAMDVFLDKVRGGSRDELDKHVRTALAEIEIMYMDERDRQYADGKVDLRFRNDSESGFFGEARRSGTSVFSTQIQNLIDYFG